MKIEQFRQELTTEQLNDRLSKVFGTSIDLDKFSTEQLTTAQSNVVGKIQSIEQTEAFDSLSHNEEYHKQKMFLDVINSALEDRAVEGKLQNTILVHADEIVGDYFDMDKEALKMNKDAVIADMKKRQQSAKGMKQTLYTMLYKKLNTISKTTEHRKRTHTKAMLSLKQYKKQKRQV